MCKYPQEYIGKITNTKFPYYDIKSQSVRFKARPVMIVGCEYDSFPCDFTILPVSKIQDESRRNQKYDHELNEEKCRLLNLKCIPSFIRCHKIGTVSSYDVDRNIISDIKVAYPILFDEIHQKYNDFNSTLF
ncbi:hypothetical protein JTF04_02460 [Mammaliicoccus vitulinus]|uniref:hypothetical protein n=1 Tax=Mammaliicoccus vitulinus TaxID=71237 RepID=UPI00036E812A|nr:hypothetical protein [Mammaliicoccus vitulinus]MBM6628530.1 hypothetical protein [Mammaliicoccus vitulinus]MEB7656599.1 hypothetical protein [Mammaliicoccus vitulinus]WQK86905.1 hypothetical protein P3U62_07525 [Mammaliicoccus vitulinus]